MQRPLVFIPCYNAQDTIIETIKSARIAVKNSGFDIPIWICDDCSTDGTWLRITSLVTDDGSLKVFRNEQNLGERRTTNIAANKCAEKFDWMFILHADDIAKPDWLVVILEQIRQFDQPNVFTVWGSFDTRLVEKGEVRVGDDSGAILVLKRDRSEITDLLTNVFSFWHISGAAINLKLFARLKGFDEKMAQFGDTDFFVRGLLNGYIDVYISRTLTEYRVTKNSVSSVSYETNRDLLEIDLMIRKYSGLLGKKGKRKMLSYCIRYSASRATRALVQRNWLKYRMNIKTFIKSLFSYPVI